MKEEKNYDFLVTFFIIGEMKPAGLKRNPVGAGAAAPAASFISGTKESLKVLIKIFYFLSICNKTITYIDLRYTSPFVIILTSEN